jgi:hypothetical protein
MARIFYGICDGQRVGWRSSRIDLRAAKGHQNNYRENEQMYGASPHRAATSQRYPRLR